MASCTVPSSMPARTSSKPVTKSSAAHPPSISTRLANPTATSATAHAGRSPLSSRRTPARDRRRLRTPRGHHESRRTSSPELRPGIHGGLTHSYALTSHAAEGHTHHAARTLATDSSSRPGIYVGLTRGQHDSRLYASAAARPRSRRRSRRPPPPPPRRQDHTRSSHRPPHHHRPRAPRDHPRSHRNRSRPAAGRATACPSSSTCTTPRPQKTTARLIERAISARRDALARRARSRAPAELIARIGPRPHTPSDRRSGTLQSAPSQCRKSYATSPTTTLEP